MVTISSQQRNRNALGRGLRSLIPEAVSTPSLDSSATSELQYLTVDDLLPGDGQPRQNFEEVSLKELSDSIAEHGVLQPLVVRRRKGGQYEIVAGERRWRAAKLAGLKSVPCVVSDIADRSVLTLALVENIQREDLNVIEEAESYKRLGDEIGLTQDQIAQAVGKDRSTITNALRLLKLPHATQRLVIERRMTMGHARALLSLRDVDLIEQIAEQIAHEGISVRKTEELVQERLQEKNNKKQNSSKSPIRPSPDENEVRRKLEQVFGTKVDLREHRGKGAIVIHFSSVEQLNGILDNLNISL